MRVNQKALDCYQSVCHHGAQRRRAVPREREEMHHDLPTGIIYTHTVKRWSVHGNQIEGKNGGVCMF